jgi:threonine dehydrogenase-like Zn-dependent dehydrogenase
MKRLSLWFEGGERVSVREEDLAEPGPGEVLVRSAVSAISAGTEMLFYRGTLEEGAEVDSTLAGYRGGLRWPLRYGYATVGTVEALGAGAPPELAGRTVFCFVPHASAFTARVEDLLLVPEGIGVEDAAFFASAETAANLVLDTAPMLGERISVYGLGIIGLLVAGLLSRFPLTTITGWDLHQLRREGATMVGVKAFDPRESEPLIGTEDAAVELSGSAEGFKQAMAACGFAARLVVGSWYGAAARSQSFEAFDTTFHRKRLRMVSSQVSTIDPGLTGRWDQERRRAAAWDAIRLLRPARWITQRVPFRDAGGAYRMVSREPARTIQVMMTHAG